MSVIVNIFCAQRKIQRRSDSADDFARIPGTKIASRAPL
jgi:hypothetical protein